MRDFGECYATLGLPAGTEWEVLRAHYKRLIRRWHPDRFAAGSPQQRLAEEKSKQITAAYQTLERYRRDHGALPPAGGPSAPRHTQETARNRGQAVAGEAPDDHGDWAARNAGAFELPETGRRRWGRWALSLAVLGAVLYLAVRNFDISNRKNAEPQESVAVPVEAQAPPRIERGLGEQGGISLGSTIGDVYAVQGIPTDTRGDVWYYGKSLVRFANGSVISWEEDPATPLRIARNQPARMLEGEFKYGSTKDEVRAVQGNPVTETATVWDYGLSRVYFENGRVVRWEESPMQRLRVPH